MSRVINTNGPGKVRNQLMRTGAEMLRRLTEKQAMDDEARDIAALLVFCLQQIDSGIDDSARAWEKRDYWVKAEQFRARWYWTRKYAGELTDILRDKAWEQLPMTLVTLLPYFEDIKVARYTRSARLWKDAYQKLLDESSERSPS